MNFLEQCRTEALSSPSRDSYLSPLHEYDRTRIATLVSWCTLHRVAELLGVCESTLTRAMLGSPVQSRTLKAITTGLDALYDAIEPAIVRLARAVTQ